jgi:hypothetical protein
MPLPRAQDTSNLRSHLLHLTLIANSLEQHTVPMKVQELLLAAGEPSHIDNLCGVDAHSLERWAVSYRRDYERAIVLEANEPAIEEMINARRQKQAILAILVAPRWSRLATACSDLPLGAQDFRRP